MIYSLRRGSTTPTTDNLTNYELGWETANNRLYIRSGSVIVRLNSKITLNNSVTEDAFFYAPTTISANKVLKTKASWTDGLDPFEYITIETNQSIEDSTDLITSGAVYSDLTNLQTVINTALNNKVEKDGDTMTGQLIVPSIRLANSGIHEEGKIFFSETEGVPQAVLSQNVTMAIGIDSPLKVFNNSGDDLVDGLFVIPNGNINGNTMIGLARADSILTAESVIGCVTEPILYGHYGFINTRGFVSGLIIDPAIYNNGDKIYLSPTIYGGFTKTKPTSPNYIIELGYINKVSTDNLTADGQIRVDIKNIPIATDISYDNSDGELLSQTVKGALDELSLGKVDVGALSSNIILYPTTATSSISGYYRMVSSTEDGDYNDTAVDVSTGTITTTNQLIASLAADANLFIGDPGVISVTTLGNIRKTAGNSNQYAEFFFRMYHRTAAGVETLIGTSGTTGAVNPSDNTYFQFSTTAELSNGPFIETDRLVIKYYANMIGNTGSVYQFQFGGASPVRSLLPVPVSVIPTPLASAIITDVSNFNGILSNGDTNVQAALDTLDNHLHDDRYIQTNDLQAGTLEQVQAGTIELQKTWSPKILHDAIGDLGSRIYVQNTDPGEPTKTDSLWFHG